MKRLLILLLLLLASGAVASARDSAQGWCEEGNRPVVTSGLNSTTRVQASHPSCIITIYIHGAGLATIYSDNNNTPLANPFTAQSGGRWQAYANDGRYDVTMTSAGFSQPVTYSDIILCDPFAMGSTCNNGGSTTAHNLLSTTHLDTVPASPPIRGDLVVAQNQTSPTGVNPSWARLPLGTSGQVLTSTGTDAVWGSLIAGTNITLSSTGGNTTINASGGGGASPCTTLAAGTWDIVPQTCAGEKVIQGLAGNASTKNFVILPASDETAINLYSGDAASNFTDLTSISENGDNPITKGFNAGAVYNRSSLNGLFFSGMLSYNEDATGGGSLNPVFGGRCVAVGSGSGVHGTLQACESEAYLTGSGTSTVVDAYSSFASVSGTAHTSNLVGFYSSRNVNSTGTTSKVSNNYGLFVENQGGIGNNNYEIFTVNASGKNTFFVASDSGHINIPILETARLKHLCYSTTSTDTLATFVPSTCEADVPTIFSSIGTCNGGNEGAMAAVTDSNTVVWGANVAGSSTNHILAYCNGTAWTVAAK